MNTLTQFLTTYWWWYLPTVLFNIYYYFIEQPQWKSIGGLLWRLLFTLFPIWNIIIIVFRYLMLVVIYLDKSTNPETLSFFKLIHSKYIGWTKDEEFIWELKKGTKIICKLDALVLYPLGCIIQPAYWLLTRQIRN